MKNAAATLLPLMLLCRLKSIAGLKRHTSTPIRAQFLLVTLPSTSWFVTTRWNISRTIKRLYVKSAAFSVHQDGFGLLSRMDMVSMTLCIDLSLQVADT